MDALAAVLLGCTVNTSCVAAPGVMVNAVLVAPVAAVALAASVYPDPPWLILRFENVATPLTAATLVVPERIPPLGFVPIATVTVPVNAVPLFPRPSTPPTSPPAL